MRREFSLAAVVLMVGMATGVAGAASVKSGPQVGQRTLPFTSNAVTGANRGQQHCYICELKEEPAVLIFARRMDAPTARLLRDLRDAVRENASRKLFGWMVFLADADSGEDVGDRATGEGAMERSAFEFARKNAATTLPLTVLDDPQGPPGYRIAPDAVVTVLFFRNGKVLANRAYRDREWNESAAAGALRDLRPLLSAPTTPESAPATAKP